MHTKRNKFYCGKASYLRISCLNSRKFNVLQVSGREFHILLFISTDSMWLTIKKALVFNHYLYLANTAFL